MQLGSCVSESEIVRAKIGRSNCFCSYVFPIFKKVGSSTARISVMARCLGLASPYKKLHSANI